MKKNSNNEKEPKSQDVLVKIIGTSIGIFLVKQLIKLPDEYIFIIVIFCAIAVCLYASTINK